LGSRHAIAEALNNLGTSLATRANTYSRRRASESATFRSRRPNGLAQAMEGLAYVALGLNAPGRTARILGAASGYAKTSALRSPQSKQATTKRKIDAARAACGDDNAFDCLSEGSEEPEDAIRYAFGNNTTSSA
jgi:hypothetical protein